MKSNVPRILAFLVLAASAKADFFLWLDSPTRSNPNDPQSPFYHGAARVPFFVPSNTFTASPSFTPSASTTGTVSPMTATPTPSASPSATATPSNADWPTLTSFDANITANNAGGVNSVGNDNDDGCGVSTSAASVASSVASPVNGTPFIRMTYTVGINAGCGYQYASMAFPFVARNLAGKASIDFAIRSTATVRIMIRSKSIDACLGSKNRMWIDVASTGGAWQALNKPFATWTLLNAGCPFPLNGVDLVAFSIENPGSGTLDLDNISFP